MTREVWKYTLRPETDDVRLLVPACATVLSAQMQHGQIAMWLLVDPRAEKVQTEFYVTGTGQPMYAEAFASTFVGTVQDDDGLVWHIFANLRRHA